MLPQAKLDAVDKAVRKMKRYGTDISPEILSVQYVTRPFRDDVSRCRAIFTWMTESIVWESGNYGDKLSDKITPGYISQLRGIQEESEGGEGGEGVERGGKEKGVE
ncbi:hypothetical protein BJ684DRAFT_21228 [Piptocephalis cylindrospora]|uniref:Uncharacterized protein n=1 Tax=Piptocephalis cylindrospora TaxID=1907219 RepID=A0A4P9Y322_9FUNG|nr:hypothetical protein BJ684DRAFT_21228 [Piptocephalis cylindrospora]|eukprot:RKP12220.1 hypothetical protein BJ684DRAFT_21228 [Piptocephalis cylindrospora]